jgi:hypothetical protein
MPKIATVGSPKLTRLLTHYQNKYVFHPTISTTSTQLPFPADIDIDRVFLDVSFDKSMLVVKGVIRNRYPMSLPMVPNPSFICSFTTCLLSPMLLKHSSCLLVVSAATSGGLGSPSSSTPPPMVHRRSVTALQ